MGIMTTYSK